MTQVKSVRNTKYRSLFGAPRLLASNMKRLHQYVKRASHRPFSAMATAEKFLYHCDADVEPLRRYRPGGYHPIHIGDTLGDRYTVLHKLGWGGFSTVWAVRDLRKQRCFALKAVVSEKQDNTREIEVMRAIASSKSRHPGLKHLLRIHDHFQLRGPNGTHSCLVLDIEGANIPGINKQQFGGENLSGRLVKLVSKQIALGVACLHQQGIGHSGNIVLSGTTTQALSNPAYWRDLDRPQMEPVRRNDGQPTDPGVPKYLVHPVPLPSEPFSTCFAKIADFGEAFLQNYKPERSHTPLVVRPPEAIFGDPTDCRADLWSMGCMFFELATGQPPFESIMVTPVSLVEEMLETTGQVLPQRWQASWLAMADGKPFAKSGIRLQEWLEDVYFDEDWEPDLSREDIKDLGQVIQKLLRLEPAERTSAEEILQDPWFRESK